jgi:haloalkane dehalogenase
VDEGQGQPVLLVHGTPTWSFLYRHLIWGLSTQGYRVIAVDHLGFGLSDKPEGAAYRPADHSRRLAALVEHLRLSQVDLVVHDFGGPIALGYATEHPENVRRIVLFNTWMWSLAENRSTVRASGFAAGPIGRFLYRRMNFSPKVLMKAVVGDKSKLTPEAHRHYVQAFPDASARMAPWVLARELIGSSEWYDGLWARRERLRGKPALLLWGMKDPTFGPDALARWQEALPQAEIERFPDAGHFVQEEEGAALVPRIDAFLRSAAPAR